MSEGYKGRVGREVGLGGCSGLGRAMVAFYGVFGTRH